MCTLLRDDGRPAFLRALQTAGVTKLTERQALANVVGKLVRRESQRAAELLPGDSNLFLTPWNWALCEDLVRVRVRTTAEGLAD